MKIKFTKSQWERISEILANLGILSGGSIAIPALFDKFNWQMIILGLVIMGAAFYFSIIFARRY